MAPSFPTCKGRVIDFFVVSVGLAGAVVGVTAIDDAGCKPHRPVRLYLKAKSRALSVRMMKGMETLPAVLPHGPPKKWDYNDTEVANLSLDQKYSVFITRLEEEVAGLKPMSEEEKAAMSGRAEGPKFAMRCPLGNDTRARGKRRQHLEFGDGRAGGWMTWQRPRT